MSYRIALVKNRFFIGNALKWNSHFGPSVQDAPMCCGTLKNVGGQKHLNACTFYFSWYMNISKLPKDYLYREGSFEGWEQFVPHPLPQKLPLKS